VSRRIRKLSRSSLAELPSGSIIAVHPVKDNDTSGTVARIVLHTKNLGD
jgi:hypothetical protein